MPGHNKAAMKLLITGANGLLGQKLVTLLSAAANVEVIATGKGDNRNQSKVANYQFYTMDITSPQEIERIIGYCMPDAVIHAAGMTNVAECETAQADCWQLNVEAVKHLLAVTGRHNIFFQYISSDFVFDGKSGPYAEEAEPAPINFYGKSKMAAEQLVQASSTPWAIVRAPMVYGVAPVMSRSNLVLWVKESLEQQQPIFVVNDQWRTPVIAEDLAMGCFLIAKNKHRGVFNISGKAYYTPYEMALATAKAFGLDPAMITETDCSRFEEIVKRPAKTGLQVRKAEQVLGFRPRTLEEGLAIVARQLRHYERKQNQEALVQATTPVKVTA